jgi:hypothetical protein
MRCLPALLSALSLLLVPEASAQDDFAGPVGFAYAQAPEAGSGTCFGLDAIGTIECAQYECAETSGLDVSDCNVDIWCAPHGYVADIFMQHEEGPHWHAILCGAASRDELDRLVAVKCDADHLIECTPVRIWNAEGDLIEGGEG